MAEPRDPDLLAGGSGHFEQWVVTSLMGIEDRLDRMALRLDGADGHRDGRVAFGAALWVAADLGPALREERQRRGLALRDAAEQIGCGASALGAYERGERWPSRDHMAAIAGWVGGPSDGPL